MSKKRDIGLEILEGIRAIKHGEHGRTFPVVATKEVSIIRKRMKLSQSDFSSLLGVSVRTIQDWEQGRRNPKGPAAALLRVADRHPKALLN